MSDDLKPCPFCGCTLVDCDDVTDNNGNSGWHVYCPQCFCDGPGMDCKADAIAAWNRRASDAEIERLRADNKRLTDKLAKIAEQETYK